MVVTNSSNEVSTAVIAVHLPDKKEQVLFDEENGNGAGPRPSDLKVIKWTGDSKAFFIPANCSLRYYDFDVYALENGQWNEIPRENLTAPLVEAALRDQVDGDMKHLEQDPVAWIHRNVLEWTFSRGGDNEAVFYYRLTPGPKGMTLEYISGKLRAITSDPHQ